jgi:demethoxyubiquinone hydroxylase (CLK1/Coq7/Cat5 family)
VEHRNTGLEHGAEDMKGYELFKMAVKTISKTAIFLAKRI